MLISAPVKTDETAADVLPAERNLDLSELEPVFEKFLETNSNRSNYSDESLGSSYISAWSKVHQAYSYANATQEDVNDAVALGNEAVSKFEKATFNNTSGNERTWTSFNNYVNNLKKTNTDLYTEASYAAVTEFLEKAEPILAMGKDAFVEEVTALNIQYYSVLNSLVPNIKLSGTSVELADYIGLNYYVNITDEMAARKPSFKFTYGEGEELVEQTIDFDDAEYVEGKGYKLTVKMNAKNMRDTVTGEVYVDGEKIGLTNASLFNTTVYMYANRIKNNPATYGNEAVAAAKALLNYGANTQTLFDYNTANLANASLSDEDKDLSSVTADTLADYKPTKEGSDDTAKFAGYNLYLDSLTRMRFYYTGDVDASANTANFSTGKSGSKNYVEITDITPANLLNGYDVTIGGMTIHASPASYAHTALTKSSDENLQNAMKAMILYSQAVQAYANSISD